MGMYRVKDGAVLAHEGRELTGGANVELMAGIAHEVRHLVDEVDAAGKARPIGATSETTQLLAQLETARAHEHITLLEQALTANAAERALLEQRLSEARAAQAPPAPAKAHTHAGPTTKKDS